MDRKDYKKICEESIPIVQSVSQFIKGELDRVQLKDIEIKDRNSLVSYVDKEAEERLVEKLSKIIPEAGFITEENTVQQRKSSSTWIIDPLDGTNNFLHRIPHFAISVALMVDEIVSVGIVYNVCYDECFSTWKSGGAYLNNTRIAVSQTPSLLDSVIATGFPYDVEEERPIINALTHFIKNARGVRRYGAAALDLAYVACGRFDSYYETTLNGWDVAAGSLLVSEAGGEVSDFGGGQNYIWNGEIIASNQHIHSEMLSVCSQNFNMPN